MTELPDKEQIIELYKTIESLTVYDKTEITLQIIKNFEDYELMGWSTNDFYITIHRVFETVDEYVESTYNTNITEENK